MTISLIDLAASAVVGSSRSASKGIHAMSIEEARVAVKIKDGNRKPAEDGSQKLTLVLGKHTLPLDAIKAGSTRLQVSAENVAAYTAALESHVEAGAFDESIVKAQELAKAQYEKAIANPVKRRSSATVQTAGEIVVETEGLDLDAIDASVDLVNEEVSEEL